MPTDASEDDRRAGIGPAGRLLNPRAADGELAGAGVLWLADTEARVPFWAERCAALLERGAGVLVVALEEEADRDALRRIEEHAGRLAAELAPDGGRLAVGGVGRGGTLAFLAGCTSTSFGAVVDLGGDVLYPELDAAHPTQPLELLLNLDRPLLGVFAPEVADPESLALLRSALVDAHKDAEVIVHPVGKGSSDLWEEEAFERAVGFLSERL